MWVWYNTRMNNTTHHNSISAFARLLATEDIRVRHARSASTASFDVVARVLTLPIWENMSGNLYDMLVGHEVAHALYTPNDIDEERGCLACCSDIDPDAPHNVLPIVNVVEDARIERLIKSKYPGLRRDFTLGYKSLYDMDIFELAQRGGVSEMGFLDRINLHFKLGILGILNVPIAEGTESWFLDRIENATTFDEVVEISRDLYEYELQQQEDQQQEDAPQSMASPQQDEDNDEDEDSDEKTQPSPSNDSSEESGGQSPDSDTQEEETGTGSGSGSSGGEDETSKTGGKPEIRSHTQDAIDGNFESRSKWTRDNMDNEQSIEMPKPNLDNMVIKYPTIVQWWEDHFNVDVRYNQKRTPESRKVMMDTAAAAFAECDEFMRGEKSTVNNLVKQFEMRKAADEHRRTSIQKSGRLDTIKMINYRWSEDIFSKNQVVTDGKNHGFVIIVDWSGSMYENLESTVKQAITLAMFCRKANIPFELYAFSDRTYKMNPNRYDADPTTQPVNFWDTPDIFPAPDENAYIRQMCDMMMVNFLSSSSNQREFINSCRILYSIALAEGNSYRRGQTNRKFEPHAIGTPAGLDLGGTPLDEALTALHWMLPEFRRRTNCQVLNTVLLTDGDGSSSTYSHNMIRNPFNKVEYGSHPSQRHNGRVEDSTLLLLKSLKDTTGTNLIGMYLATNKNPAKRGINYNWVDYYATDEKILSDIDKCFKKNRYFVAPGKYSNYFDEAYVIDANIEPDQDINLPDSVSHAKLRTAFVKGMKTRGMSRNLMNRFIEVIAR